MTARSAALNDPIPIPDFEAMLDPAPGYAALALRGPVLYVRRETGGLPHYAILDYALAQVALRDPRISKTSAAMHAALRAHDADPSNFPISGGAGAPNLLNTDGADHARLRELVGLTFSPRRVQQLQDRVSALVDGLIAQLRGQDEFDLVAGFSYPIGLTMICDILGIPNADRGEFRHLATQAMTPGAPDQKDCAARLMRYLADLVALKREATDPSVPPDEQPDILSALCAARLAEDALSEAELISMSFLILIAGHETTVGLIGLAILLLDRFPDQRARLLVEPGLIRGAIEEVLRYDGPVHATTMRATAEDVKIGGVTIPAQSFVNVYIAACNRDPGRWDNPDVFDITRKPVGSLAFGYGAHMCIGLHLARLEAQVAIARLLEAFPDYAFTGDVEWAGTVIRAPALIRARPTRAPRG